MYLVCFKWWLRLRMLNSSDLATCLSVKCSSGNLGEVPGATEAFLSLGRALSSDALYCGGKKGSVWSLGNEGGCSWEVQVQGHLAPGWLVEPQYYGAGIVSRERNLPSHDSRQGKRTASATVAFHPPPLSFHQLPAHLQTSRSDPFSIL